MHTYIAATVLTAKKIHVIQLAYENMAIIQFNIDYMHVLTPDSSLI